MMVDYQHIIHYLFTNYYSCIKNTKKKTKRIYMKTTETVSNKKKKKLFPESMLNYILDPY